VVGRGAADCQIELVERATGAKQDLAAADLLTTLLPTLQRQRAGI